MKRKILLLGSSGYIGWAVLQRLAKNKDNFIVCVDNHSREKNVELMKSFSAINISDFQRECWIIEHPNILSYRFDYTGYALDPLFKEYCFDTVINLAHQPSGPYSQISSLHAEDTLKNNILGTNKLLWLIKENCPDAHYITIGSTGEYSHTLGIPIEEGYFTMNGSSEMSIFPRRTNSLYHASKIASTYITDALSRMWNIKSTDIMQAIVFGSYTDEINESKLYTRFDTDEAFGTVCNRFMLQAILGEDLTVYGEGNHKRGFIALNDSVQALMIAVENDKREDFYSDFSPRVWNQLSFWISINELAEAVKFIASRDFNIKININHIETPRYENTKHPKHYSYKKSILESYGYEPTRSLEQELKYSMTLLKLNLHKIKKLKHNFDTNIKF